MIFKRNNGVNYFRIPFYAILTILIFSGCIEPNTEDLWSITIEGVLQTEGFARDIAIEGNTGYVAAGQAGVQVWDLSEQTQSGYFAGYVEGGAFLEFEDVSIIGRNPLNNLIFASESNEDVKIFHYATGDSDITYRNTIMSARTKGFVSFPLADDQFIMYAADNDDGMKWHTYDLDTTIIFNIEFIVWTPNGGDEIYTPGKPQGIDSDGESYVAMAVDQLGVELYSIDSIGADPTLVGRVDTEGNAEQVLLSQMGVFAACDDAGATFIPWQDFNDSGAKMQYYHVARRGSASTADQTSGTLLAAVKSIKIPYWVSWGSLKALLASIGASKVPLWRILVDF